MSVVTEHSLTYARRSKDLIFSAYQSKRGIKSGTIGVASYRALGHVPPRPTTINFCSVHFDLYKV